MEMQVEALVTSFERGTMTRRALIQALSALAMAGSIAPRTTAQSKRFHTPRLDHISFQVRDYVRTRDFYASLLDFQVVKDEPANKQVQLHAGDAFIIARTARNGRVPPLVDHFAVAVANWNKGEVEAELKRRGIKYSPDAQFPDDSFHLVDPDGFNFQIISDKVK
jgi:catechol 2,3-dioxygenase-like lactoylglutathione lyase family enzyme